MKRLKILIGIIITFSLLAHSPSPDKWVSKDAHISFYSHTSLEDIEANNYKVVSTIDQETGDVVFSVPMQSFEFEKALMQKHYNSEDFLNTKEYPKAKYIGSINNLNEINWKQNGSYEAIVSGELTLKAVTKPVSVKGTIIVEGNKVTVSSKMKIVLADYGITFSKGKPSTNIAKEVEITLKAVYTKQ